VLLSLLVLLVVMIALTQWRAGQREARAIRDFPPVGQIVDVDGTQVHVQIQGQPKGAAPDLVMLHGASGNLRDFTLDLAARLSKDYRVILMDRPGLGWTARLPQHIGAWNASSETPSEQAELLYRAAQQVGADRPIVLGHSYGGAVALAWALDHPAAALVLVAAVSEPWPGSLGWIYRVTGSAAGGALAIPLVTAFLPERFVAASIESIFAPQQAPDGYAEHLGTDLTLRRTSMRANAQQVNSLLPHIVAMQQRYDTLTLPIELIHGTADTIVPAHIHAEVFAREVPSAVLTLMPDIGHMPHHVDPQVTVDAIHRAAQRAGLR